MLIVQMICLQENAEDDPKRALADLEACVPADTSADARVLLIGISCGLSATYVGTQLAYALDRYVIG